jgi:hypothetical protein
MNGYTSELIQNGQSLKDFVMDYARSFIGPMHNRTGPIPASFKADPYFKDELKASKKKMAKLKAMTAKQRLAYGEKAKRDILKAERDCISQTQLENQRIEEMIAQVKAWKVPSKNHKHLKKFMLETLIEEIDDAVHISDRLKVTELQRPLSFWNHAYESAKEDVRYYTNELKKEAKGIAYTNTWVKQLRGSL